MFTSLFLRSLNREAASRKNRPEEILHHLDIREGHAIADLGSGGDFSRLALPEGQEKTARFTPLTPSRNILIL
jgi:hypothetical protein